ncbi:MAG: glucose-6-phosphate isomerase family protein [Candidatus Aenigmatarchaeota archaeon]
MDKKIIDKEGNSVEPLVIGENTFTANPRMLFDMKKVLYDKTWLSTAKNSLIYFFFRNIFLSEKDKETMEKFEIRYDVTIIRPTSLGQEFPKTFGHYHLAKPGTNLGYPEIYEVLSGNAIFFMQKKEKGRIVDTVAVRASAGERVIFPPNYGHLAMNTSNKILKLANWDCSKVETEYDTIGNMGGGTYFFLNNGNIIENKNYIKIPELRTIDAKNLMCNKILGKIIPKDQDMYDLIRMPEILRFLTYPEEGSIMFEI